MMVNDNPAWWFQPTRLKNDRVKVSWDDEIPNMMGQIIHSCSKPPTRFSLHQIGLNHLETAHEDQTLILLNSCFNFQFHSRLSTINDMLEPCDKSTWEISWPI